jgi:pSer/pThr/pTyr-binding forkhead associated (FHA) protein
MQHRRDVILNQPALIPIAGNFDRKPRALDRDVTTIGRARGSDLCLEAKEISTLHCVVYRTADGYRIRDCNSRCGTRINGDSVKNGTLHNGDIVNLGPFSFEFRLPTELFPRDGVKLDPIRVEHWKNSRRRLAERALKLRKRLLDAPAGPSVNEREWEHKAQLLKDKIRCYDQRLGELEDAEEELTTERQQLARDAESHRQHIQKVERDLADRLKQADEEIRTRWQEFQQRCQAEEARAASQPIRPTVHDETLAQLKRESDDLGQHLHGLEDELKRQHEQLLREQQEFTAMKDQWVKAQTKSSVAIEEQQSVLAEQETTLRAQKAELMRMMGDVKKMQEELRKQTRIDVKALQEQLQNAERENAELRAAVQNSEQNQAEGTDFVREIEDLRAEVQLLSEELDNKEHALLEVQQSPAAIADSAPLVQENERLQRELTEKDRLIAELTAKNGQLPKTENDLERYETELNEFRRQLEGDRNKLNNEVEMLRERNKELDEAIREMEMEMSKERAELARERMRLERVREEVKSDAERLQRELAVRDSMAPVQKLRDELVQKQPTGKNEKPLNDRLRGMRNQLSDNPAGS